METNVKQTLYPLVRSYMDAMGTSRTTLMALKSYSDAIRRIKCADAEFKPQIEELHRVIRNTEPQLVPLVHLIEEFEGEMAPYFSAPVDAAKSKIIEILDRKSKQFESATAKVTECCMDHIAPDDFIIVHSPTAYLRNAFVRTHTEKKRPFKVLVLKQDFLRTKDLVDTLNEHGVDHLLVPEHNLSHYLSETSKLFISAVTLTSDRKAITGLGTANVVSICHSYKVPVYLFAESIKLSHKPIAAQHIYKEECTRVEGGCEFLMTSFSHDYVELSMVDHIITEKGETALAQLA